MLIWAEWNLDIVFKSLPGDFNVKPTAKTAGPGLTNKSKLTQSSSAIWGRLQLEGRGSGCGLSLSPLDPYGPSCRDSMDLPLGQMPTILAPGRQLLVLLVLNRI